MSRITTVLITASLAVAGGASAWAVQCHEAARNEAGRSYEWSAHDSFSEDARRARDLGTVPAVATTPFYRISLQSLT